jgi:dihydroorotate dehydrogenase
MIFISPPFGNYIHLPNTIPIRGSFTLNERPGKWGQILKTLRYIPGMGWVNRIGLRNPGIDYAIQTYKKGQIISIAIMEENEIKPIVDKIPEDMDIELNVSCPNTDKHMVNNGLKLFLNPQREWCIIKLSPQPDPELIDTLYQEGFRQFHASNTLPTRYGGLSGRQLIPYTSSTINYIKKFYKDTTVIAGGGIYDIKTLNDYKNNGANHFSVSSIFFHPFRTITFFSSIYF